jgi:hypothetical protein
VKCSRAGCSAEATQLVVWRNPAIHTDGRTKTWLACAEHVDFLREYLGARNFLLQVKPVE